MRISCIASLSLTLCLFASAAVADDLDRPLARRSHHPAVPSDSSLPQRGTTMSAVERAFGQPSLKHAAVGGGSAKRPPITRWDYSNFSVFFEYSHVIDTVVPADPPPLFHTDELKPASS